MSWASLANNRTVSFNNLQNAVNNGVFTAKTSIPASNEQITKADANTYVNINTSYGPYAAKASNQLVVKSDLQASQNAIGLSAEANEAAEACGVPFTVVQTVTFSGTLAVGTQINSISVTGNNGYFLILSPLSFPQTLYVIGVNDDGEVIYLENICPF